ncbi:hypothetical protein BV372_02825 [Nostoc sp. T09]|uniref:hypothetical protein n=1 Tax=Nostoc sp. T09 TaxID=1932621 RepID=UPI000A3C235D|nr:hypothetical protein [Nostoc sp. T09]OUL37344.1 hypothetical protein BV372_02825 [Nostoc sp. T09]
MDFIKKLISGIVSFLTGLLPGKNKKSNGYYLELDESKDANPLAAVKEAAKEVADNAKKAAETVTQSAKKATESVAESAKKATETVADNAKKVPETVKSDAAAPSKPASLNGTKAAASKSKKKSDKEPKPADVKLVQTAEGLTIEPGNNEKAASAKVVKEAPKETTFAPKYVAASVASTNGRRRPGANMSAYLDMARQVKTPG